MEKNINGGGGIVEKLFQSVGMSMICFSDFQSRKLAEEFLQTIHKYGNDFIPEAYDHYEPLKLKYNSNDISDPVKVYMNEADAEVNKKRALLGIAGSSIMLKNRKKIFYHVEWNKVIPNPPQFYEGMKMIWPHRQNYVYVEIPLEVLENGDNCLKFISLCNELAILFKSTYGHVTNASFPGWGAPQDIKIRLPEIRWMNYYGKAYIDLFGEEKLLSTPCFKAEKLSDEVITIQATENLFEPIPDNVKIHIKKHLDEDAFVWDNKPVQVYKDGKVPEFDLSGVTFVKPEEK